ncbi:MAG: winged helix-turn-helix transcriptional regulator [Enterobacteriaceae bacterium]
MTTVPCYPGNVRLEETGFGYTLSLINGKYKMVVLFWLSAYPPSIRFNGLKRCIGSISFRTLSNTLKELERDQLVIRTEYPQIPPKVEYSLSERGKSLIPLLDIMCAWGEANKSDNKQSI